MNKIKRIKLIILIINLIGVFTSRVSYAKVYGSISGRVYLEQTGQGVEGCIIEAFAGLNLESVTEKNFYELVDSGEIKPINDSISDKDGHYVISLLPSGKYLLTFSYHYRDSFRYSTEDFRIVTLPEGKNIVSYDFKLVKLGSISGILYAKDGITPLSDLQAIWAFNGDKSYITLSPNPGQFTIDSLPSFSNWQLYFSYKGHIYYYESILNTSGGKDIKDLRIIAKEDNPTGSIGKVTSPQGLPLKDAYYISFEPENKAFSTISYFDSTGNYIIEGLPAGKYFAEITRMNYKKIFYSNPIIIINGKKIETNFVYDTTLESKLEMSPLFFSEEDGYKQCRALYRANALKIFI